MEFIRPIIIFMAQSAEKRLESAVIRMNRHFMAIAEKMLKTAQYSRKMQPIKWQDTIVSEEMITPNYRLLSGY